MLITLKRIEIKKFMKCLFKKNVLFIKLLVLFSVCSVV